MQRLQQSKGNNNICFQGDVSSLHIALTLLATPSILLTTHSTMTWFSPPHPNVIVSFTLLQPLHQTAPSLQPAAVDARLERQTIPWVGTNSTLLIMHVKRLIASISHLPLLAPGRRRGGSIGWPLLRSLLHLDRGQA
jgi:hypothetical protein